MSQLNFVTSAKLAWGFVIWAVLLALPCAIVLTLVLIRQFRGRVARSMRATATIIPPKLPDASGSGPDGSLEIERIDVASIHATAARANALVASAQRQGWRVAAIYAAAAAAYSFLLATALILAIGSSPIATPLLVLALLYLVVMLPFGGTQLALAPTIVLKRQPRFLILAVLALIAVMWALDRSIGVASAGLWLSIAAVPTAAILLLNARRLRAIGPVVFAAALLFFFAFGAGFLAAAVYIIDVVGPMTFARVGLAPIEGIEPYLTWFFNLPAEQVTAELSALLDDPTRRIRAANPQRLTTNVWLLFYATWLIGTGLGIVAGWVLIRWLARSYRARRASDQMLTIDVLMLIFAIPVLLTSLAGSSWVTAGGVFAGLTGYKLVTTWGLRWRRAAPPPVPRTLLLLRVFGFDRRTQWLLDDLGQRWRYLGPIRLIGGTDLAYATIEPHEFFEFLNGRLSRAFIKDEEDLENRLAESTITPDPDGLFRVEDFFCHDDTWRMTVSRLAQHASAVLMDLRGFTAANQGCIFEIEELIAAVPVDRIVLLVDGSTDLPFLERTLEEAWRAMPAGSPNRAQGRRRLRVLQASASDRRTLNCLLGLLSERPVERALAA